jgi:NAD(P)-dependent dehydrogenase (short-subunit alcohol dehydrogenase family)
MNGYDMSLFQHLTRPDYKFGNPDQIAGVVAMIASEDGSFMTGEIIKIDGGCHS